MHQQSTLAIARKAYKTSNWSVQQSKRMPYQFHHRLTVRNCVIIYNVPLVESLKNTSGGSRGGPPLFLDQTGAWGAEKNFLGDSAPCPPLPLSKGLDDCPPLSQGLDLALNTDMHYTGEHNEQYHNTMKDLLVPNVASQKDGKLAAHCRAKWYCNTVSPHVPLKMLYH